MPRLVIQKVCVRGEDCEFEREEERNRDTRRERGQTCPGRSTGENLNLSVPSGVVMDGGLHCRYVCIDVCVCVSRSVCTAQNSVPSASLLAVFCSSIKSKV